MGKNRLCYHKSREGWIGYINISKVDFRAKITFRDQEGYYTRIKESVHQKSIPIIYFLFAYLMTDLQNI